MSSFSRSALILCMAIIAGFALLMLMPLGVAANALGITARHVQGTIMSGALRDASLGRVRIGDVNARLQILPLFTGRVDFSLSRGDAPHVPGVSGAVGSGWNGVFADRLTATIDGGGLVRGMDGSEILLESVSFAFANGKCSSASGVVRLSLDETALGSVLRGGMMGNATCRDGDLVLPLLSQSTMERAQVRIKANGSYQATFTVNEPSPENAAALSIAGFRPVAGGLRLVRSGKLN
jgi:general secretion pathway protein N